MDHRPLCESFLEENIGVYLCDFRVVNNFFNRSQKTTNYEEKLISFTASKFKTVHQKTSLRKRKGKPQTRRSYFQ